MNKKLSVAASIAIFTCAPVYAQPERPRLVVGIVVDQMRWDYLYRYAGRYCEGGFKRLLTEGFSCENTRIPYVPSVTAIGHTCIYTGSVPSVHGIAGNDFVITGRKAYCTTDTTVAPVGTNSKAAQMSPRNLWTTTIGDEMKIASNGRAKVVGIALKDRASILPAGHNPNAAYWFDDITGNFVTSTYYMDKLPVWVNRFNGRRLPEKYLSAEWNTLYPATTYVQSTADGCEYEDGIRAGIPPVLPLNLPSLYDSFGYGIIRNTPFGNSLTLDMAMAAVEGESLGTDDETDLLAVSCSATDYIGHQVGTNAVETEDAYLRLDRDLATFLTFLDTRVGRGNYLLFLTADHGAMNNAGYLLDRRIPAGTFDNAATAERLNAMLHKSYPQAGHMIKMVMNDQVFLNHEVIDSCGIDIRCIKQAVTGFLKRDPAVLYACNMESAATESIPDEVRYRIVNGYCRGRSGDVAIVLKPNYSDHGMKGTSHGSWNPYDTHIPLVFMGWGIKPGSSTHAVLMTDIAPTIASMLHIQAPNGCIGQPIF